jgi:hypothetical protein
MRILRQSGSAGAVDQSSRPSAGPGTVVGVPTTLHKLRADEFRALAARQDHLVSRVQLAEHGVGHQLVARRVASGLWQSIGPQVVALFPGGLTRCQQMWSGVLHAGGDAVLARLTALEAAGLTGFDDDWIHVCLSQGDNTDDLVDDLVQVRVHESRNLPAEHLLLHASPPRMRQDRAVVDAASAAVSERACRTILTMSVQQRLATAQLLRPMVVERRTLPRRATILECLDDLQGGSHSLPEQDYLRALRRAGMPLPTCQRVVRRPDGRYVLDADFDEWLVTVEINGAHHMDVRQKEWDDIRRTRLAIGGRLVVDIGSWTVRRDSDLAVLLTADALLSRGWRPTERLRAALEATACRHSAFSWTSSPALRAPTVGGSP